MGGALVSEAWCQEARNFVRAFSGAFLFGIPLVYTMEMWWLGLFAETGRLLWMITIAFVANFGLAVAVGFRRDTSLYSKLEETVDAVAVGAVAATILLLVLNQLSVEDAPIGIVGKIIVQMLPLSLGASIANAIFGGDRGRDGDDSEQSPGMWRELVNDVGATATGAIFIAASIAPTEEVPTLAARLDIWHALAVIALSLAIGYVVVFASGFDTTSLSGDVPLFQHPITETALAYLVSLLVSLGSLLLMHQVSASDPPQWILVQTLALGLPAMVGGAAGRIAV